MDLSQINMAPPEAQLLPAEMLSISASFKCLPSEMPEIAFRVFFGAISIPLPNAHFPPFDFIKKDRVGPSFAGFCTRPMKRVKRL